MEGQADSGQSQYQYQSAQWSRLVRRNTLATTPLSPTPVVHSPQFPSAIALPPNLLPQQSSVFQAQLANYNKLISSGKTTRAQSSPLPPLLSAPHIQAVPRRGSGSYDTGKGSRNNSRGGHGNKNGQHTGNGERPLIAAEDNTAKMPGKKYDLQNTLTSRPLIPHHNSSISQQSSSVPSTPHQHARKFSLSSREPSPNAPPNHSPRSAYSESNSTLPSIGRLPPLPPKYAASGCQYETSMAFSRRRMAYSIGSDRLEKAKPGSIKPKLTADEERKLSGDMRELYDRLLPGEESEAKRKKFVQKLEDLLNTEWPGHDIKVHMFGSSGNLLCTDESDVDICITTDWKELEGVCKLAELLSKHGMQKVICVSTAKVPIVKVWDPELSLACDMNVNNTLALENTRMMKTYVQIDERVRPLAMIIKHWTKTRLVNDAAFGGTLSSYTWICMIINFLQTRNPPVLPALHQRPHLKKASLDGRDTTFADDLEALQGFGNENKETLGELLFGFFRFYGHEMDYDKQVVSVRNGKVLSKTEKGWHIGTNNGLCVEEPFNTSRNLGNTADDYSFRGLHLELRRAFDLIADGKLDECCEEYIFPEEEERTIFQKPRQGPKPILSRTPSSTRGGGGNSGGSRNNNHQNGKFNRSRGTRRASHGTFDSNPAYLPPNPAQAVSQEWLHSQQSQLHTELYTQLSQLKAQENNLRFQLYTQSQQYAQMQVQAYAQVQRAQSNGGVLASQSTERNRGSSFDNPPLTAPIRPDMYFYPMLQHQPMYGQHSPSTYPSSPSMSPALPELRRSLHRSSVAGSSGPGGSNSSLRSHSQPATRSVPTQATHQNLAASIQGINGFAGYYQQPNSVLIPNFMADENGDPGLETQTVAPLAESPPDNGASKEYVGYYVNGAPAPPSEPRKLSMVMQAIPAFGEIQQNRRLSTDQFPHAIFDRVRRTSRSPSPLGHNRAYSTDTGGRGPPIQHSTSSSNLRAMNGHGPLVVNGSTSATNFQPSGRQPSYSESSVSEDHGIGDTAVGSMDSLSQDSPLNGESWNARNNPIQPRYEIGSQSNGASQPEEQKLVQGLGISTVNLLAPAQTHGLSPAEQVIGMARGVSPNGRLRHNRLPQNGGVSPLDIGPSQQDLLRDDFPHLSPVYEAQSPSPTTNRKLDLNPDKAQKEYFSSSQPKTSESNAALKFALANSSQKPASAAVTAAVATVAPKQNGHTRASKSEGSGPNTWQKIPKGKKKGQAQDQKSGTSGKEPHNEKAPKNENERKGG